MKQRIKKVSKVTTTLIIVFSLLLVTLLSLTMAYFTDSKSYTGTLNFGNVTLKVTDKNGNTMEDGATMVFDITRTGEVTQKLMPGDTIGINFNVSLQGGDNPSEPAYYLVSISDTEGVLDEATYYHDGTNVVKNTDSAKSVGELTVGQTHAFNISKQVPTNETRRGVKTTVSVKVYAVQKANLQKYTEADTSKSAYHILTKNMTPAPTVNLPSLDNIKSVVTNWSNLTSNGFYYTKDVPSGYSIATDLTSSLDAKLDADSKGLIKIYKKSDTEIAFVSDNKIVAPNSYFAFSHWKLTSLDLSNFDTSKMTSMRSMFSGCYQLTSLDLSKFNTTNVTDMGNMFENCVALTSLDLSSFNTSNVTDMSNMFGVDDQGTTKNMSLKTINFGNNFNTSKVTNMSKMFKKCSNLTGIDLSKFDTSKVTDMSYMFYSFSCADKTFDLSSFDTSEVTNMSYMFKYADIDSFNFTGLNTSKVTNMSYMFSGFSNTKNSLDLSGLDTSNVTDMSYMFYECRGLKSLNVSKFNTSKVTNMSYMFDCCNSLESLNLSSFDTSKVSNMNSMFSACEKLTELDLTNFVVSNACDKNSMFSYTFSKNYAGSTLKLSSKFIVYNKPANKYWLNYGTSFNKSVKLMVDGVEVTE